MEATGLPVHVAALSKFAGMAPGGVDTMQVVMLLLGVIGLVIVILSTRRRIRQSQLQPRTSIRETLAQSEASRTATRDLEDVMLELDQLSRDIHGRIDTKMARLEALIREADRRIVALSPRISAAETKPALEITLDQEDPFERRPDGTEPRKPGRELHASIYELADRGLSPVQIANELGRLNGEVELILALRKSKEQAGRRIDPRPTVEQAHSG